MEDLKKLVKIISKRKQRQFPLLEFKSVNENSSKENIFFRYIKKGIVNTDDEASNLIYGTKSDDDRFRMLKSRLKQKLLNHVFFLDFTESHHKPSSQYEQECIQHLHQAKMLLHTGEYKVAKNLVLKALTTAERCEFTKYTIISLEDLVQIYSDNCQPHLFEDITKQLAEERKLYEKEVEAREHFYFIKMMIVKSVNSRKKNLEKAEGSIEMLEKLWKETKSFNVFDYLIQLKLLHKELIGDFQGIVTFLSEVETGKYQKYPLNAYRLNRVQLIQAKSFAYLRSWQFEEGLEYVESNIDLLDKSTDGWVRLSEIYFYLSVHSKHYKKALATVEAVFGSKVFGNFSTDEREKWRLYNHYLQLVYDGNFHTSSLNANDVVGSIPEYNKDKEGFNFAVIVFQCIYFIERGEVKELIPRRDELKQYMANHFKENFSYRSRTFYKLLNIVVENGLDVKAVQHKCRYLVKKMHENKIVGDAYQELEIIPYDHLWDLIMKILRKSSLQAV